MKADTLLGSLRRYFQSPLRTAMCGFLVGTVFGLVVFGWWLWPVEYIDAVPSVMKTDYQIEYLMMTIDSFVVNGDADKARERFESLGAFGPAILMDLKQDPRVDGGHLRQFEAIVAYALGTGSQQTTTPFINGQTSESAALSLDTILFAGLLVAVVVAVAVGGLVIYRRRSSASTPADKKLSYEEESDLEGGTDALQSRKPLDRETQPLERFVTSYVLGDDLYEDSFTINSPAGDFLGECGVGISEPIGVGEPKKVTALEVWLFDRVESRSSTAVLLSQYAHAKQDLRATLAPRGIPISADSGSDFWLETKTLQLHVVIRDIQYGKEPLPENSYFEKAVLQLEIFQKSQ